MEDAERVEDFVEENDLGGNLSTWLHDLQAELGEVSKELLEATEYGEEEPEFDDELESEVGDLYFSLLAFAGEAGIDLSKALDRVIEKYEKRMEETGDPGSGE